jgi:hypothetical protein
MEKNVDKGRCLTDEEIGTLAIQLGAQERGTAPNEGQSAEPPVGLSSSLDESMMRHLQGCDSCRRRLMSEARIYRAYFEPVDTTKADLAISRRLRADLQEILKGRRHKLLFCCPDESSLDEALSLAAATDKADSAPLMFAEKEDEGDLIFKKEQDLATGKEACYLVSRDSDFVKNAEVLIDGQLYRPDAKGRLEFGDECPGLSEDTIIIVFPSGLL